LDASSHTPIDETSIRYDGWRIVLVCFLLATFGWGLGFYGQSVYVAELHRLRGWPASLISSGTTFFYLFGAALVAFVSEAIKAFGPRNCLIAGTLTMAVASVSIGQVREPWQLYLANAVLAFGWAGTSLSIITNTLGLWFDQKRGMAISLALNGASFGGIIGVPGWDAFATSGNLKDQNTFTDVMGYCSNQWISDYVYMSELNYRASKSFDIASASVSNDSDPQDALLVWGRSENGNVTLEPAFKVRATGIAPEPGPYLWQAQDALGQVLITLPFDAPEVADLPDTSLRIFSFVVPMSADTMSKISSVHLSKDGRELTHLTAASGSTPMLDARAVVKQQYLPNHKMQFFWDAAQSPLVMLRDAKTGEVRGFLRGGSATIEDAPDDLEVQFSDGIHSNAVGYQRPAQQ